VPIGLDFEAVGGSAVCYSLFALSASSHCKHDMGDLSSLNTEVPERVPTSCFGRLVRCSIHVYSFTSILHILFLHFERNICTFCA